VQTREVVAHPLPRRRITERETADRPASSLALRLRLRSSMSPLAHILEVIGAPDPRGQDSSPQGAALLAIRILRSVQITSSAGSTVTRTVMLSRTAFE
jgi:hypothetical protein